MDKWHLKPGTVKDIHRQASSFLREKGKNPQEAQWLLQNFYHWTLTDFYLAQDQNVSRSECQVIEMQLKLLAQGVPFQYVIGEVSFLNHHFSVNPDVLIPRPETEEWVKKAFGKLKDAEKPLKVLDIGTGSGIIAVSHALYRPQDQVMGTDISDKALRVARENAEKLGAHVKLQKSDLFGAIEDRNFSVIYSNPPYIAYSERGEVGENVIAYEPHEALFAEKEGLAIYQRLAEEVRKYLDPEAYHVFLEIGYRQKEAVADLLQQALPEAQIACWRDFNGLDRVIHVWYGWESEENDADADQDNDFGRY